MDMAGSGTSRDTDIDTGRGTDTGSGASVEVDVTVLGGGGAAEALAGELDGTGLRVAVIEAERVGGDCPFVACMPSKSMLHDANSSTRWDEAVKRRENVTEHLDDRGHARQLGDTGAQLIFAGGDGWWMRTRSPSVTRWCAPSTSCWRPVRAPSSSTSTGSTASATASGRVTTP
jgi:choline dehydrogenase-like flavoprotein